MAKVEMKQYPTFEPSRPVKENATGMSVWPTLTDEQKKRIGAGRKRAIVNARLAKKLGVDR